VIHLFRVMSAITVGARAARRSARRPGGFPARTRRANARGAMAAATAQLAANSRRGSRTLVVDGFPNGYGALAGRPDRAAGSGGAKHVGFQGFQPGPRGARGGRHRAVSARCWARNLGTSVLSLPRAVGGGNCGCNRPRARCRPSAAPPGGGAHRPACDHGAVSARCWLGKPHLGGE
jgi:hypothetical protein